MNTTPHPSADAGLTQPIRLAHYELLDCIGRGGMGLVYRARDTRLDRLVAIKCLRTELFESHYIERFKREALLLAKLNHPNIVQIYDFIEAPDQLALVMELVE
ncbi:MAG TPA: protein kinase, partial [Cellvibrio sp.]|nr:protein kinase [Cellvibrio sp.]